MNTELYRFLPGTDINAINKTGRVPRYITDPKYDTRTHTFSLLSVKDIYWDGSLTDREPAMFLSGNHSHLIILSGVCLLLLLDRKSTRLNSSHSGESRMPSSA